MIEGFLLAWRALARGRVPHLLVAAALVTAYVLPRLIRSDGTVEGWREMYLRSVPGAIFAFTFVAVLAAACGVFSRDRENGRLPLTLLRPAGTFVCAFGRWLALLAVAALALAAAALSTLFSAAGRSAPDCRHRYAPVLPPPVECARASLAAYLADPQTPAAVKRAPRHAVLALLTARESDRYESVPPGEKVSWDFALPSGTREGLSVRVRFATAFDMRAPVNGVFTCGGVDVVVSNSTQNVFELPLAGALAAGDGTRTLEFSNRGKSAVMLRPRRDLELLAPADSFARNTLRAFLELFSLCALGAGFGLFLSAALSRPVALFTAGVAAIVVCMAPSVVAQYPDQLDVAFADRIGLAISNAVNYVAVSVSEPEPISNLATGNCVEWGECCRALAVNAVAVPLAFLAFAAVVLRRKSLPDRD